MARARHQAAEDKAESHCVAAEDKAEARDWDLFVATLQADAERRWAADIKVKAHCVDTEAKAWHKAEAKAHCVAA